MLDARALSSIQYPVSSNQHPDRYLTRVMRRTWLNEPACIRRRYTPEANP